MTRKARLGETPRRWLNWGGKAFFAILDQGLFAGANFIVNVLLARWISSEAYGALTIAFAVFLLLSTVETSILTNPLLVFGPGKYTKQFPAYLRLLLVVHIGLTAIMSLVIAAAAVVLRSLGSVAVAQAFLGLVLATPFVLLLWLVRAACYVRFRPDWAAMGGGLYAVMLASGFYGMFRMHMVSPASAFVVMGLSSLIVAAWLLSRILPQAWLGFHPRGCRIATVVELLRSAVGGSSTRDCVGDRQDRWEPGLALHDHFRFARWQLASSATDWAVGNLHYFVLSSAAGLSSVAAMRVLDTMLFPYYNYQAAMSKLITPVLARRAEGARTDLVPYVTRIVLLWVGQAVVAYILIRTFAGSALSLLYDRGYSQYAGLLGWYGLVIIAFALSEILVCLLQVMVRTDLLFVYGLLSSSSLLTGLLIVGRHGLAAVVSVFVIVRYAIVPVQIMSTYLVLRNARDSAAHRQAATSPQALGSTSG